MWPHHHHHHLLLLLLLLLPSLANGFAQSLDGDFTFTLPAGRTECFYQALTTGASMEVEYQVIDGAGMDVDFSISSPTGQVLFAEYRKSEGLQSVEAKQDGDYMFCFDNSFSHVSEKVVFFEVILDNMEVEKDDKPAWKDFVAVDEIIDMKLEDLQETMDNIKTRLGKSIQMQSVLRVYEARDRKLQETNFEMVNLWSGISMAVLVVVAGLQVYTLRSLFNDQRRVRT
ncbi:transmembrane emp24 domain-containing protein 1-like [Lethenteron reissneri]|uniref:transmembrane emp24 domain-containing protein 1-like n=1 Tax=Lethenteron reissneri TaxID=7753 RepID=UPI002AB73045|nr:transmembrane emp24 domain-containing protein 1-like [Lethenteron reissneri]